jgi:hypothetical protein
MRVASVFIWRYGTRRDVGEGVITADTRAPTKSIVQLWRIPARQDDASRAFDRSCHMGRQDLPDPRQVVPTAHNNLGPLVSQLHVKLLFSIVIHLIDGLRTEKKLAIWKRSLSNWRWRSLRAWRTSKQRMTTNDTDPESRWQSRRRKQS